MLLADCPHCELTHSIYLGLVPWVLLLLDTHHNAETLWLCSLRDNSSPCVRLLEKQLPIVLAQSFPGQYLIHRQLGGHPPPLRPPVE